MSISLGLVTSGMMTGSLGLATVGYLAVTLEDILVAAVRVYHLTARMVTSSAVTATILSASLLSAAVISHGALSVAEGLRTDALMARVSTVQSMSATITPLEMVTWLSAASVNPTGLVALAYGGSMSATLQPLPPPLTSIVTSTSLIAVTTSTVLSATILRS